MRAPQPSSLAIALLLWSGQTVSLIGSGLTVFALSLWVYQGTGSVTQLALVSLFTLPGILFGPVAGTLVDRFERRTVLIASDLLAGLSTLFVALLLFSDQLAIWHIYIAVACRSLCDAFRWPSFYASVPLLVPEQQLGRANGMIQFTRALAQIAPPALAGSLLLIIQIEGVILIDVMTFFVSILSLLFMPKLRPANGERAGLRPATLRADLAYAWHYLATGPGLIALMLLFTSVNFLLGIVNSLVTPLVLAIASSAVLGIVMTTGGLGTLFGSIVLSIWGGPKRYLNGILGFLLLGALCLLLAGFYPTTVSFIVAAAGFYFGLAISNGCFWTIWQRRIAQEVQGRIFAIQQMLARLSLPLGAMVAGPLADYVFEPLMANDGLLAGTLGQVLGTGDGRGISLMFILVGILLLLTTFSASLNADLRRVEEGTAANLPAQAAGNPAA